MPIHDWTRVTPNTWHAFHTGWIWEMQTALNNGVLPSEFYAQAEQVARPYEPDVLTLQTDDWFPSTNDITGSGGVATLAPLRPRMVAVNDMREYAAKARNLAIRHNSGDRIVAVIELVSPGNKATAHKFRTFVEKAANHIVQNHHMLIVDLFPPGPRDPFGLHNAIWQDITSDERLPIPTDAPLSLIAYAAGLGTCAYVEHTAVGRDILEMPLFLTTDEFYVNVPLEETYQAAYRGVPRKYREILDATVPA